MKTLLAFFTGSICFFTLSSTQAYDDYYIPGKPIILGFTYTCEQDENPCTGQLIDTYTGNLDLDLDKIPIIEAGVGIGPCAPKKLAENKFQIECPLEIPPESVSSVAVTFNTFPDGLNQKVRQDTTVTDEEGTSTETFYMPPRPEISPSLKLDT